MSSKRDYEDVDDTEPSEPENKRARRSRPQQSSSVDPNSGQKYVFANYHNATTIPAGEESDFEDDTDAMAYLMSVRTQASGIPHVLAAPKKQIGPQLPSDFVHIKNEASDDGEYEDAPVDRSIYNTGISDNRGFYEDGAYIGRAEDLEDENSNDRDEDEDEDGEASDSAVQEAYFDAILQQYQHLRVLLNKTPPQGAAKRIPSRPTVAAPFGPGSTAIKVWPPLLRSADPTPLQVSLMSKDTVIRIIRIMLGGKFLRRGYPLPERTSRWIWALLARLPERGELNYSEMGWIRDLGRRAVLLGRSLSEMAALREELAEGGLGVNDAVDDSSSDEDVVADEPTGQPDAETPEEVVTATASGESQKAAEDTGEAEAEEEEDVAMDTDSDSDEGEIREDDQDASAAKNESLEAAKLAFLARLDAPSSDDEDEEEKEKVDAARERSRMNMRATLNMILTVAGEFYGQRDLLEFREPFVGM
ncbi:hypothetical protein NLG97_g7615 [Lecanicillium saksenae]|uniref:Uncharacterized protein n=1 Tax=Lecanicillium saksenae TaxID=468837 RepID=A0ACC1QNV1_9HYPO|nr:hypothetical protein NLG97_g7615 [Lecanicillium saksenae]